MTKIVDSVSIEKLFRRNGTLFMDDITPVVIKKTAWTPTVTFSGGNGTLAYVTQIGWYTVYDYTVHIYAQLSANKGTAAGSLIGTGIPTAITPPASIFAPISLRPAGFLSGDFLSVRVDGGTGTIIFQKHPITGIATDIDAVDLAATFTYLINGIYLYA